jgi:hypothetical protein
MVLRLPINPHNKISVRDCLLWDNPDFSKKNYTTVYYAKMPVFIFPQILTP